MAGSENTTFYNNKSLERALQILRVFNAERPSFTLSDLSETVLIPKATVLRLCSTLVQYEFLRFNRETKKYSLGLKLFELGSVVFASFSLRRIAVPYLVKLQEKVGRTVFLGILQDGELVYLDKKEDPLNPVRFASRIGTRRPPYFGMLGNTLMAYLSEAETTNLLNRYPLIAITKKTLTDDALFRERLGLIRSQGYYIDREEAIEGIAGVAAPVRDFSGEVVAVVGVGFISSAEDDKGVKRIVREAQRTAATVSQAMGYIEQKANLSISDQRGRRG
jgi:DNA-binding IclR family transcriptional regulator